MPLRKTRRYWVLWSGSLPCPTFVAICLWLRATGLQARGHGRPEDMPETMQLHSNCQSVRRSRYVQRRGSTHGTQTEAGDGAPSRLTPNPCQEGPRDHECRTVRIPAACNTNSYHSCTRCKRNTASRDNSKDARRQDLEIKLVWNSKPTQSFRT